MNAKEQAAFDAVKRDRDAALALCRQRAERINELIKYNQGIRMYLVEVRPALEIIRDANVAMLSVIEPGEDSDAVEPEVFQEIARRLLKFLDQM